jgi:proteasome lid subunit RPN8/RPN11
MISIPFSDEAIEHFRQCAMDDYPNETCGYFLNDGTYQPCQNTAKDKHDMFMIGAGDRRAYADKAIGVGHSHTGNIIHPTGADIAFQVHTGLDFALCRTDGNATTKPLVWGPSVHVPLLGRRWRWGPAGSDNRGDCWACVKDAVKEYTGLDMRDVPRDEDFWERGENLLNEWLPQLGWVPTNSPTRHGIATFAIGHRIEHHLGFIIDEVQMVHHLPPDGKHKSDRLSTIEPIEKFKRHLRRYWKHPTIEAKQ